MGREPEPCWLTPAEPTRFALRMERGPQALQTPLFPDFPCEVRHAQLD